MYRVPRTRSVQKFPSRPPERRAMPRASATAAAIPDAADVKLWKASCIIWERYDIVTSPEYDCQFVLVVNDAAVSKACRFGTAGSPAGVRGSRACSRSATYVASIDTALNNSSPPA